MVSLNIKTFLYIKHNIRKLQLYTTANLADLFSCKRIFNRVGHYLYRQSGGEKIKKIATK